MADLPQRLQPGDDVATAFNYAMDALDSENRTKIIKNQGIPQVLLGFQNNGFGVNSYGLKVSKVQASGIPYDVTNASNDQLAFSSAFNNLKVVKSGTYTLVGIAGPGNSEFSLAHGLGYIPVALVYGYNLFGDNDYISLPAFGGIGYTSTGLGAIEISSMVTSRVDATNLIIGMHDGSTAGTSFAGNTYTFKYYFLQETAN